MYKMLITSIDQNKCSAEIVDRRVLIPDYLVQLAPNSSLNHLQLNWICALDVSVAQVYGYVHIAQHQRKRHSKNVAHAKSVDHEGKCTNIHDMVRIQAHQL